MTFPSTPSRFPVEFEEAFKVTLARGEVFIPSSSPEALKTKLWAFQRALRGHGRAELADAVSVLPSPGGITLRHRSHTPEAREISLALKSLEEGTPPSPPEDDSLSRILGS